MDLDTLDLPTSSRPPPAGQDSVDFKESERDLEEATCSGVNKDLTSITSTSIFGTHQKSNYKDPTEIVMNKKAQPDLFRVVDREQLPHQINPQNDGRGNTNFYEHWRNSLESLLSDTEGRNVFYRYLAKGDNHILLDCLEACETFRSLSPKCDLYVSARDFYKRFIQFRDLKLKLHDQTRSRVNNCMRTNSLHTSMFCEVEQDVYSELRNTWYDKFIDSDLFLNYCLSVNNNTTTERINKEFSMPILHEEEVSGNLTLHAIDRLHHGAHGQDIKGKSLKVSDELRRSSQQPISCQFVREPVRGSTIPEDTALLVNASNSDDSTTRDRCKTQERRGYLPNLPHFKPRTERINREAMKPMKPEDFARILTEKLEKVIQQRAAAEGKVQETTDKPVSDQFVTLNPSGKEYHSNEPKNQRSLPASDGDGSTKGSCKYQGSYPQSDRYSAVGMSSVSGSEIKAESQLKYKHGAKELASAIHHALRTELKECQCKQCLEKHNLPSRTGHHHAPNLHHHQPVQNVHCMCCLQNQQQHHYDYSGKRGRDISLKKLTPSTLEALETAQNMVDRDRIYMWMEQNEKFQGEMARSAFSDSTHQMSPNVRRRHKTPVVYDTTRVGDSVSTFAEHPPWSGSTGLPVLQQPDTSVVLKEAKRRLEDNARGTSRSSRRNSSKSNRPHHSHQGYMETAYADTALSTTSGNWTLSDSASSASRQQVPSVVSSSIPSSASQFLNESISDLPTESMKSHGSGSSRGHRKDKTVVTYFLGLEPIPYRTSLPGKNITLAQFKPLITKKGNFRYFFKTKMKDDGIVYQQIEDDCECLPKFENKIVVKVEKVE
eukprot:gene8965-9922_t